MFILQVIFNVAVKDNGSALDVLYAPPSFKRSRNVEMSPKTSILELYPEIAHGFSGSLHFNKPQITFSECTLHQTVLLGQMKQLSLKTQQRFSVSGTCFDVSNVIINNYEYAVKIYKTVSIYNYSYTMNLYIR